MGKEHTGNSYFSEFGEGGSHIPCHSGCLPVVVFSLLGLADITEPNLCGQMALCLHSSTLTGKQEGTDAPALPRSVRAAAAFAHVGTESHRRQQEATVPELTFSQRCSEPSEALLEGMLSTDLLDQTAPAPPGLLAESWRPPEHQLYLAPGCCGFLTWSDCGKRAGRAAWGSPRRAAGAVLLDFSSPAACSTPAAGAGKRAPRSFPHSDSSKLIESRCQTLFKAHSCPRAPVCAPGAEQGHSAR